MGESSLIRCGSYNNSILSLRFPFNTFLFTSQRLQNVVVSNDLKYILTTLPFKIFINGPINIIVDLLYYRSIEEIGIEHSEFSNNVMMYRGIALALFPLSSDSITFLMLFCDILCANLQLNYSKWPTFPA